MPRLRGRLENVIRTDYPTALTDLVREPLLAHVVWVPNVTREIRGLFVHVDEFDELRIQMRVSERPVHHQRIVEMLRRIWVVFESMKLDQLRLKIKKG